MSFRTFFVGTNILFLSLSGQSGSAVAESIILAADNWCPYNCEPTSLDRGFMIDIVSEVLKKHGYKVEYKNLNWTKAMEDVAAGRIDGLVGAGASEAKNLVITENPLGINKTCFYGNYGTKIRFKDVQSLKNIKIGVIA
ncbi:MAG: transporter substrate-binding domain-containing protein, partial [Proteobacteria bacterium]|nr:transporter substrate-binding domain-containing protein [Pseudomonadota bacterium]